MLLLLLLLLLLLSVRCCGVCLVRVVFFFVLFCVSPLPVVPFRRQYSTPQLRNLPEKKAICLVRDYRSTLWQDCVTSLLLLVCLHVLRSR